MVRYTQRIDEYAGMFSFASLRNRAVKGSTKSSRSVFIDVPFDDFMTMFNFYVSVMTITTPTYLFVQRDNRCANEYEHIYFNDRDINDDIAIIRKKSPHATLTTYDHIPHNLIDKHNMPLVIKNLNFHLEGKIQIIRILTIDGKLCTRVRVIQ